MLKSAAGPCVGGDEGFGQGRGEYGPEGDHGKCAAEEWGLCEELGHEETVRDIGKHLLCRVFQEPLPAGASVGEKNSVPPTGR